MKVIDGVFYRDASSASYRVTMNIDDAGNVSLKSAERVNFSESSYSCFSDLDISSRLGDTPRHIVFKNGDRFETNDNNSVDALLACFQKSKINRFIHFLESRLLIVLSVAIFVITFVWGFVQYGVPAVANNIAEILPIESSQYLGQGAIDIMDRTVFDASELPTSRQQDLASQFQFYANNYPEYSFEFLFRKGGKIGANAMALPDGKIIFTDEMIALAENDNELIAILGHEIGHVVHKHILRRIIQDSMLTIIVVMISGDVSSASSLVVAMPSVLLELAFSREFEREADDFAYKFLIDNDIPTQYFSDIMQRLALSQIELDDDITGDNEAGNNKMVEEYLPYLSTHPATQERIQKFQLDGG